MQQSGSGRKAKIIPAVHVNASPLTLFDMCCLYTPSLLKVALPPFVCPREPPPIPLLIHPLPKPSLRKHCSAWATLITATYQGHYCYGLSTFKQFVQIRRWNHPTSHRQFIGLVVLFVNHRHHRWTPKSKIPLWESSPISVISPVPDFSEKQRKAPLF